MGDDSMSDDVFEVEEGKIAPAQPQCPSVVTERLACETTASSTGYRDYKPPDEVLQQSNFARSRLSDNIWSSYKRDNDNPENCVHKVREIYIVISNDPIVSCPTTMQIIVKTINLKEV
jgi:Ras-related protein Rab-37